MLKRFITLFIFSTIYIFAKLNVAVSIAPEAFIVENIAKDLVDITTVVPPGSSPHTYEPKPSQMRELSRAKIYFAIGVEFERAWLNRFQDLNKELRIIHIDKNITKYPISQGEEKGELDPHIWLDPINLKVLASNIYKALSSIDKTNSQKYQKNLKSFLAKLDKLHQDISQKLSTLRNRKFLVFHPSWGYYAKRYNLEQIAIEIAGKEPKPKDLIKVIKTAKKYHIKVIIAQPEFSTKSATIIANEIGGVVVKISPMQKDVIQTLLKITNTLLQANGAKVE